MTTGQPGRGPCGPPVRARDGTGTAAPRCLLCDSRGGALYTRPWASFPGEQALEGFDAEHLLEADVALDGQVFQSSGHLGLTWIRIPWLRLGPQPGLGVAVIADASEIDGLALRHTGAERGRVLRRVTKIEFPGDGDLCIEASSTATGTVNCTRDGVGNLNSISLLTVIVRTNLPMTPSGIFGSFMLVYFPNP